MSNVPVLRFAEFTGKLDNLIMGDIADFSKGKGIPKADISEDGKLECIRYGQLYTEYKETIKNIVSHTNVPKSELVLSEANDIIIPASGETQIDIATASCVLKSGVALGGDLNIIRTKHDGVFLSYYLNSERKNDIARLSQGISVVHLYSSQLKTLKLNLPTLPEQKKIANFLSAVDSKIELLGKKKALLEQYKKGAMQQLFPSLRQSSGQATPELRFPVRDGLYAEPVEAWEVKRLGDVYKWVRTNNLSRAMLTYEVGEVQNIHYGDIHTKYSVHFDQDIENAPYIINADVADTDFCTNGDLIIADASEDYDDIGKATEIINVKEKSLVAGLHTYIARPKINMSLGFSGYLFQSEVIRKQIKKIAQGISVLGISKTNLEKVDLPYPCPEEQQKLANFLSSLDKKIEAVQKQIEQTEAFKKGLLQKMFV